MASSWSCFSTTKSKTIIGILRRSSSRRSLILSAPSNIASSPSSTTTTTRGGGGIGGYFQIQIPCRLSPGRSSYNTLHGGGGVDDLHDHNSPQHHHTNAPVDTHYSMDFPGGKITFTSQMTFLPETLKERVHCYRVLDDHGTPLLTCNHFRKVTEKFALKIYTSMVTLQAMDEIFYEAQRQGRISFYATTIGEEAINIASAAALAADDIIVPQYREPGVLLWRGFTIQEFANQCFGNNSDYGKGRQMPIHYGSKKHNYFTVASTIASQLPHAVGAAYSLKMEKKNACAVSFFGDGGTSEGDFHAALNFAAVMDVPVIFICRNNGWAISTPVTDQFRSDGIAVRGQAYGVRSIRVDGNDALAMLSAVNAAREMAITEGRPILIEALTYRVGHHSTSDDSTKYRPAEEIQWWRTSRDPVARFRKWIERNSWWDREAEAQLRSRVRKEIMNSIQVAEKAFKPPVADIFTDVYDVIPSCLTKQEESLRETIRRHPKDYDINYLV